MSVSIARTYPQLAVQLAGSGWSPEDLALVRGAYELACELFAGRHRGSGKPFVDHLVGTASCLVVDGAPPVDVAAGLLHAAYDQGDFGDGASGVTRHRRSVVRAAVGAEVEQLVAAYQAMAWGDAEVRGILARGEQLDAAARAVLRVRVANEIEDRLDAGLVLSGKAGRPGYALADELFEAAAALVGGPGLQACAVVALAGAAVDVPAGLALGRVGSSTVLPRSARVAVVVRVRRAARRWRAGLRRRLRRRPGGRDA